MLIYPATTTHKLNVYLFSGCKYIHYSTFQKHFAEVFFARCSFCYRIALIRHLFLRYMLQDIEQMIPELLYRRYQHPFVGRMDTLQSRSE